MTRPLTKATLKIFTLGLVMAASLALCAGEAFAQSNAVKLTVVPEAGMSAGSDPSIYHFKPEEFDNGEVAHTFTLENDTKGPVAISRIDTSCSCTSAVIQSSDTGQSSAPSGAQNPSENITIAPGGQIKLKVTVALGDSASGDIDKAATVFVVNQTDPAATMRMIGTVDPAVMFAPTTLNFGTVPAGAPHTLVFAIGFSRRAPGANSYPTLISTIPYLRVAPTSALPLKAQFPSTYRVLEFKATLDASAPMGPIDGMVQLASSAAAPTPGTGLIISPTGVSTAPIAPSAPTASLPVRAMVTGDLSATPQTAIFGTVPVGKGATIQVTVASRTGKNLSGMRFSSDQPWLSGRVVSPAGGAAWTVALTIDPSAPAGAYQPTVTGEVGSQRLVIPVLVYIVSEK